MSEGTVYVVDDDEAVRRSLCYLLESDGLEVRPFGTAAAYLDEPRPGGAGLPAAGRTPAGHERT